MKLGEFLNEIDERIYFLGVYFGGVRWSGRERACLSLGKGVPCVKSVSTNTTGTSVYSQQLVTQIHRKRLESVKGQTAGASVIPCM